MTIDDYREEHPRGQGVSRNEYDLTSYQDWRAEELDDIETRVYSSGMNTDDPATRAVLRLLQLLREDPRR